MCCRRILRTHPMFDDLTCASPIMMLSLLAPGLPLSAHFGHTSLKAGIDDYSCRIAPWITERSLRIESPPIIECVVECMSSYLQTFRELWYSSLLA